MQTYQLHIDLSKNQEIKIGKLGTFLFKKGGYIYTGSAKKNIDRRIKRHLSKNKRLHWHIDFFLNSCYTKITNCEKFDEQECILNQKTKGEIPVKGFGSSDCKSKCSSHLKFIEK